MQNIFSELMKDAESIPQTLEYKINKGLATLKDQDEVLGLKDPKYAYLFARDVKGANINKCQEAASKDPWIAYLFAKYVPGADKEYCKKACVGTYYYDYFF